MTFEELCLDLDGVFADFYGRASELLGCDYKSTRPADAWAILDKVPHLFRELPMLEDGRRLWEGLQEFSMPKRVLTAKPLPTGLLSTVEDDKRAWAAQHLSPTLPVTIVDAGVHKARFANPRRVLIDDLSRNIAAWTAAGGIGILHRSAERTLTELRAVVFDLETQP